MAITVIDAPNKMSSGNRKVWKTKFAANGSTTASFSTGFRKHELIVPTNDLGTSMDYTDSAPVLNVYNMAGTESAVCLMVVGY